MIGRFAGREFGCIARAGVVLPLIVDAMAGLGRQLLLAPGDRQLNPGSYRL